MEAASLNVERISLALDQLKPTDGTVWEEFANSYLASEFPQLRPIGGLHDKARDAFLYEVADEPGVFVQHSVQAGFETKICGTIAALQKNGFKPTQLVYCTPHDIVKQTDDLKRDLRRQSISLDIRDRAYFIAFRNTSSNRILVSEELARKFVDPLLKNVSAVSKIPHALSDEEERTALAYFELSVQDRVSEKSLVKLCYETLVRFALRGSTPEDPVSVTDMLATIQRLVPHEQPNHLEDKVKGTLSRLATKGVVKHHTKPDAYALAKSEREALGQKIQSLLSEQTSLISDVIDITNRVATDLEIDYEFDARGVSEDTLLLCDYFLLQTGRDAAKAFQSKTFFNPAITTLSDFAKTLAQTCSISLKSLASLGLARFLDLIPQSAERVLKNPTEVIERSLGRVADSYYLLFVLKQSPEVIQVVDKVVGRSRILLDASSIVPCMAEILSPRDRRQMTMLFSAARNLGVKLHVGQEAINELLATIRKARAIYASDQAQGRHFGTSELVEAYDSAGASSKLTFNEFMEHFAGPDTPQDDLKLFLKHHLGIDFADFEIERAKIDPVTLEEMAAKLRPARKMKPISQETEDILIRNDVTCLLLIEALRKDDAADNTYGFSWWWLTRDRAAYSLDRARGTPKTLACMSPDFFLRYLSVQPRHITEASAPSLNLPLAVEVAAVGLVPEGLKEAVEAELTSVEDLPKYMRIRKIRDAVNAAKTAVEAEPTFSQ